MNLLHRWYCRSGHWRRSLQASRALQTLVVTDMGQNVLEIGPGPGLTTEWLCRKYQSLTCIEFDRPMADALSARMPKDRVSVVCGDATEMPFADCSFSGVVALNMLHHIPSAPLQDRLFAESFRVLAPGGTFIASDRLSSLIMTLFHIGDTMTLLEPDTLPRRLAHAGFTEMQVSSDKQDVWFVARRA